MEISKATTGVEDYAGSPSNGWEKHTRGSSDIYTSNKEHPIVVRRGWHTETVWYRGEIYPSVEAAKEAAEND